MARQKGTPNLDPVVVAAALRAANGFVSAAAESLKCSYAAVHQQIATHDIVREAVTDARIKMLDFTESKLFTAIKNGEAWAIALYLKTQGKERGYIERTEHTGADGSPVMATKPSGIPPDKLKAIRDILNDNSKSGTNK